MIETTLQAAWRAHGTGDLTVAARLYREVLRRDAAQFDANYGLGVLLYQTGEFAAAEAVLKSAAQRNPGAAPAWFTLGCVMHRLQRANDALTAFDRALALTPAFPEALVNKGSVLMEQRRFSDALVAFDAATALRPDFAEAWNNRGNALSELGRHAEAVASYDRVLALNPQAPRALVNRGTALLALQCHGDALASYSKAARLDPGLAEARNGEANLLFILKRYDEAAHAYEAALAVQPDLAYGAGNLAFARLHACDWSTLDKDRARIADGVGAGRPTVNPFQALSLLGSEVEQQRAAALWVKDKFPQSRARDIGAPRRVAHPRIRLAYLSTDFQEHAVATLSAGLFEHHDCDRFETIAISLSAGQGAMRERLQGAFTRFIDGEHRSDAEVANLLRELEVDIAVDLNGFTGECRPGILASRPAAIQVQYLGFPGTMAAPHIDYLIADRTVIPETARDAYSEMIAYLPDCYLPNDAARPIAAERPSRTALGLPEQGFVFASFNASYKFTPAVFDVWCRLLNATEGSVLWVSQPSAAAAENLRREAAARGVNPDRIVFAPLLPRADEHLARLAAADIFLDTLPYNAHSSACDALWAGVPVVTAMGEAFAGRVGASLLTAAGLPELIAASLAEYEGKALALARDPPVLAALRSRLAANRLSAPLFDTARYTRDLETLLLEMKRREEAGLEPAPIG